MEWLQLYKIGKQLLEKGLYQPWDAYYEPYKTPKYEVTTKDKKKEYHYKKLHTLDIVADLDSSSVNLELRAFDEESIQKENYFTSVAGNFTSFYLATPYFKPQAITDFLETYDGKDKFKTQYESLIKDGFLNHFQHSTLVDVRNKLINNKVLTNTLNAYIKNLPLLVEKSKAGEYLKRIDPDNNKYIPELANGTIHPLTARLDSSKDKGKDEISLLTLKVIENGKGIYLNQTSDYKDFCYARFLSLANIKRKSFKKDSICYFLGSKGSYPVTMPRDNIDLLKVSTDTTINFNSFFKGDKFLMSKAAFEAIKLGAWYVDKKLTTKIGGIRHYLIPDFFKDFDLSNFKNDIKPKIDLAFQHSHYKHTGRLLDKISAKGLNTMSFIGFEKDDKKIEVINRIQTLKPDRYNWLIDTFENAKFYFDDSGMAKITEKFSFGSIYTIFPNNEKKKVSPTLVFFKNLLEGHTIPISFLMNLYQKLLHLHKYGKVVRNGNSLNYVTSKNISVHGNGEQTHRDQAISRDTIKYLVLIKLLHTVNHQQLNQESMTIQENPKTEAFFEEFNYHSSAKRALFYLGKLLKQVAYTQEKAKHAHKPILQRVNYNGMKVNELKILQVEILQKLQQYNKTYGSFNYAENDLANFQYYFCKAETSSWTLSEIENVFYLFTGYSMYWQVVEEKEKPADSVNEAINQ